ncbi:MAG: two-component system sensor histidine kinase NtrB, partial [Myxococcaceae bacterium]
ARLQRQILACMPSGLITCEGNGAITFVNEAGASILSLDMATWPPSHIESLIPGVLTLGLARRSELTVETPVGRKTLGLNVSSLGGSDGALLVVFQDLTELRRAETELKRIDHLAALGALSAQLAHEIRNPLASMRGSAQMLGEELGADRSLTGILMREADRLSSLLDDFLRFARPPPPSFRLCSLTDLVTDTVDMLRADPLSSGVKLDHRLQPLMARIDPDQMRQVLLNLIRNALIAVGPGGQVRVEVEDRGSGPSIRVWDSAGSIAAGDLERIFDPFFTTREGGTGLGLSTAHSIVRAHGGMIQVSSSPGVGTQFVIGLPSTAEATVADTGR